MKPPIFVLSSGHSGTKSIATMLDKHINIDCVHERTNQGQFGYAAVVHGHNRAHGIDDAGVFQFIAERIQIERHELTDITYWADSNWRLFSCISDIKEFFPNAIFIHLLRDGRASVAGREAATEYYADMTTHDLQTMMPLYGPMVDPSITTEDWGNMSRFDKLCWMWAHITKTIRAGIDDPGAVCRIEEIGNPGYFDAVLARIGVSPKTIKPVHENRKNHDPSKQFTSWSLSKQNTFAHWCGSEMDWFYPGWRDGAQV